MLINSNSIQLNVELLGCELNEENKIITNKPVLIAVPGGPGFSHTLLKPGLSPIAKHFPLVYVDPRGTGKSDICDESSWTITQHAEDLIALCKTLGIKKPVLYGYSVAAHYVARAAAIAPEYIYGLVLSNCITADKNTIFDNLIQLGGDTAKRLMVDLDAGGFPDYAKNVLPLYNPVLRPAEHEAALELNATQSLMMVHHCFETSLLLELDKSHVKALYLLGRLDPLDPAEQAIQRITKSQRSSIEVVVFDESGHDILLCEPERAAEVLLEFLNTLM